MYRRSRRPRILQHGRGLLSRSYYQHAFDLRSATTDRERLYITTSYYSYATGERERAIEHTNSGVCSILKMSSHRTISRSSTWPSGKPHEALRSARRALGTRSFPSLNLTPSSRKLFWATGDSSTLQAMCDDPVRQATIGTRGTTSLAITPRSSAMTTTPCNAK